MDDVTTYKSLKDQVTRHEKTIEQLVQIIAATNAKVAELQVKLETYEDVERVSTASTPHSIPK
ncbi:MAG TPA: hypothetical protein VK029_03590 [Pseudogracilibacillus sp.]|nr:hypothetical protein [Pseudogracilibacillus sp.]